MSVRTFYLPSRATFNKGLITTMVVIVLVTVTEVTFSYNYILPLKVLKV